MRFLAAGRYRASFDALTADDLRKVRRALSSVLKRIMREQNRRGGGSS